MRPGRAPKPCLIAAQPIQREVGLIGETEKAALELDGRIIETGVRAAHCMQPVDSRVRLRPVYLGVLV
jgi:hypothetical protein